MSSAQHLRQFISERLTAAAEEIFTEFEKTIIRLEEETDRHRRLLDISRKPQINWTTIEPPPHCVQKEEEVLTDQQLFNLEMNSSLDQEELEPSQMKAGQEEPASPLIKEEQEELCIRRGEEHLVLKLEADNLMALPPHEKRDCSEPEPNGDRLLSQDSPESENQEEKGSINEDPVSSKDEDLEQNKRNLQTRDHKSNIDNPELKIHKKPHMGEKPYCDICGKHFAHIGFLTKHMRSHMGERPFSCGKSLYRFTNTHTGEKSLSCKTCGRRFYQNTALIYHMRTHTGEKLFSCKTRGKSLSQNAALAYNLETHSGENLNACNCCGKHFPHSSLLTQHMRSHTGEKPFSCKTCGKNFSLKSNLFRHMITHTGEKPLACGICGKRFNVKSNLCRHMRTHSGEKPFSCETCGKGFSQSRYLTNHMRTHTGERPFTCATCGKSFTQRYTLVCHMRIHM